MEASSRQAHCSPPKKGSGGGTRRCPVVVVRRFEAPAVHPLLAAKVRGGEKRVGVLPQGGKLLLLLLLPCRPLKTSCLRGGGLGGPGGSLHPERLSLDKQ